MAFEAGRLLGTERKRSWVAPRSLLVYAVLAEHLHRDPSMITRLYAAYMEKRDKRSESELQRWLKIKSTTFVRPRTPPQPSFLIVQRFLPEFVVLTEQLRCPTTSAGSLSSRWIVRQRYCHRDLLQSRA